MPLNPTVTLKQVATRAGFSTATVSYALRGHGKIPAATRQRIQAAARALGYRINPHISNLMAHIRRANNRPFGENLAFVWVHTPRTVARTDPFLRTVYDGARARAAQAGFGLEDFYTEDPGMTNARLEQIIRARGIVGIVLSPVTTNESAVTLDWDWSAFAPAVIGNVSWTPELHHAGHHHYLGMRTTLRELRRLGCTRVAAIVEPEANTRGKGAWEAAFLTHHEHGLRARSLLRLPASAADHAALVRWLAAEDPEAVIVSNIALLAAPGLRAWCRRHRRPVVTLYWNAAAPEIGGVDQCYDRIAAHAVDLVIAQINSNETGVPDLPRMMLFPGRWVAGAD